MGGTPIKINEEDFKSLKGKTVLITGASSGIGLECADYFYKLGCNVAYIGGRKRPPTEVPLDSPRTLLRNVDISNFDALVAAFEATIEKFGKIDIVVPNAGVGEPKHQYFNIPKDEKTGKLLPLDLRVIDIDVKGTAYTVALGIHYLQEKKEGSIIMMTSMAGYAGVPEMPSYSASKHAATGLLRSLTGPCLEKNIALSIVAPSITFTPGTFPELYKPGYEAFKQMYDAMLPLGFKMSQSITCAHATAYLAAKGIEGAGQALLIEADEINELEKELESVEPAWFVKKKEGKDASGRAAA